MGSVLAPVGKKAFEQAVMELGVGVGLAWPLTEYQGHGRALRVLEAGGALFLVTVRTFGRIRVLLVAKLESPAMVDGVWVAEASQTPIFDITDMLDRLEIDLPTAPADLAKALRKPWELTEGDVAILEKAIAELTETTLAFQNPRQPQSATDLTAHLQEQLSIAGRLYDGSPLSAQVRLETEDWERTFQSCTLLDLAEEDGRVVYEAWFHHGDSGTIFRAGTTEVVAEVVQCGLECEDEALRKAIRAAVQVAHLQGRRQGITIALW
jgi:hypothetical protein